jgi:hypothetical protein
MSIKAKNGWIVNWFEKWEKVHDEAMKNIPACSHWPNELLQILFDASIGTHKKIALITQNEVPIAMVVLRAQDRFYYEPIANSFTIPGFLFLGKSELASSVLLSLQLPLRISWWRMSQDPPSETLRVVRKSQSVQHYIMNLNEDFEDYWRSAGHFNTIRRMRKRCQKFTFSVDPNNFKEGCLYWIMNNWGKKWKVPQENLANRILSAKYLELLKLHHCLVLFDGDRPVAGHTFLVHNGDLVWLVTHRDESYEHFGVGTRLMDLSFHWAKEAGFNKIDLGTTQSYKSRWAPISKQNWTKLEVCPEIVYRFFQAKRFKQQLIGRMRHYYNRLY